MKTMTHIGKIYPMPTYQVKSDPFVPYTDQLMRSKVPLIIDNGSYQCRAGWATEERPSLVFRNLIAKLRGKKENETHIGNDIKNIEVVRWLSKTQFDKNVVTQFDIQESIFDYIFNHLCISTEGRVDHPVVITEPPCNPNYSRQMMSELLFECYNVPQVGYGIDSLFSFYNYNCRPKGMSSGLVVSVGHSASHVLPVLRGGPELRHARRLDVGARHMAAFLQRLLQLKSPVHSSAITPSRTESLIHEHMHVSSSYMEDIRKWESEAYAKEHTHVVQLPYATLPGSSSSNSSKMEKCQALLKRVQAVRLKQRAEKLSFDEERLQEYLTVQELLEDGDDEAILALQDLGYTSAAELQAGIKKLNCTVRKTKNLIASQQDESQDSPLKNWCEELNLRNFTDAETWINDVKQKRKEVSEARQKLSSDRLKSTHIGGFSSTTANDLFGGVFADPVEMQSIQQYTLALEEKKEQIKILDEILSEYSREFSKCETNFSFNFAEYYQLHLGLERIRVPEIVFQPTMIGVEQAGLAEIIETVLARYSPADQQRLAENVFVTGGCSALPFLRERIEAEVMAVRPFRSKFKVTLAEDGALDAWRGAARWALSPGAAERGLVSRAEYEERGGDFLREHPCSNAYLSLPAGLQRRPPDGPPRS